MNPGAAKVRAAEPAADFSEIKRLYQTYTARKLALLNGLVVALAALALLSLTTGAAGLSVGQVWQVIMLKLTGAAPVDEAVALAETVIMDLRLPRILLALVSGIGLAAAGTVMQGILRNPLVDPYTLGLSGGAAFGAALAIVLGTGLFGPAFNVAGRYLIISNAFFFGLLTTVMVYGIARLRGTAPEILILGGVAIGYLFSAGVSALKYVSDHEALKELVVWLMGGLWGATWDAVSLVSPVVLACLAALFCYAWDLNALAAGEEVATNLGVNVKRLRLVCLVLSALAASATVAFTGIIGFIGLMAPHICRLLVGPDHRFLLPCAACLGAVLLLAADTLARNILAPTEIPVGIITALSGAPFFLYLLLRRRKQWWT